MIEDMRMSTEILAEKLDTKLESKMKYLSRSINNKIKDKDTEFKNRQVFRNIVT
jgi:hypothetical protein